MIYLQVPADIYRAVSSVLLLAGCGGNMQWIQLDYNYKGKDNTIKPFLTYVDGRIKYVPSALFPGEDSRAIDLLKGMIEDMYGKA